MQAFLDEAEAFPGGEHVQQLGDLVPHLQPVEHPRYVARARTLDTQQPERVDHHEKRGELVGECGADWSENARRREPYGGEVAYEPWRRQFRGARATDSLRVGKEIRSISGATISVHAVTLGVRRLLADLTAWHASGAIR